MDQTTRLFSCLVFYTILTLHTVYYHTLSWVHVFGGLNVVVYTCLCVCDFQYHVNGILKTAGVIVNCMQCQLWLKHPTTEYET